MISFINSLATPFPSGTSYPKLNFKLPGNRIRESTGGNKDVIFPWCWFFLESAMSTLRLGKHATPANASRQAVAPRMHHLGVAGGLGYCAMAWVCFEAWSMPFGLLSVRLSVCPSTWEILIFLASCPLGWVSSNEPGCLGYPWNLSLVGLNKACCGPRFMATSASG